MRFLIALLACKQVYLAFGQYCPQGSCPSDQTCCIPGIYCCPFPNAVCCSDGEQCCPQNTVCNLADGTCDFIAGVGGVPSTSIVVKPKTGDEEAGLIRCPDGEICLNSETCCLLATGAYGCCPYGTRCDPSSHYCLQADNPLFRVAPRRP